MFGAILKKLSSSLVQVNTSSQQFSQLFDGLNGKVLFLFIFSDVSVKGNFIRINVGYFEATAELHPSCVTFLVLACESAVLESDQIRTKFRAQ